jgi:hypothetical protein
MPPLLLVAASLLLGAAAASEVVTTTPGPNVPVAANLTTTAPPFPKNHRPAEEVEIQRPAEEVEVLQPAEGGPAIVLPVSPPPSLRLAKSRSEKYLKKLNL